MARRSIPLLHVAQRLFDTPLAIAESKYEILLSVLGPRIGVDPSGFGFQGIDVDVAEQQARELLGGAVIKTGGVVRPDGTFLAFDDDGDDDVEASGSSNSSKKKPYKVTNDGVAIISVRGTLVEKSAWYHAYSGMTSYQSIDQQVSECVADANIRAILLDCNTPGGETHGLFDLADKLYSLRGKKPMYGIANNAALSAGYAIISACDKVFVTRTGALGSIGVFAGHVDQSGLDEKVGLKFTYIHAGKKKVDGNPHEPLSESALSDCQAEVDREYDMFVKLVSRNRGISEKSVRATEAGVLFADNCLPLLGDAVGTLDDAYSAVVQKSGIVVSMANRTKVAANVAGIKLSAEQIAAVALLTPDAAKKLHGELTQLRLEGDPMAKTKASDELLTLLSEKAGSPAEEAEGCDDPEEMEAAAPADENDDDADDKKKSKAAKPVVAPVAAAPKPVTVPKTDPKPAAAAPAAAATQQTEENTMEYDAAMIAGLCELAGRPDLTASFLRDKTSQADVMAKLNEIRMKKDKAPGEINSAHQPVATSALAKLMDSVNAAMANSNGKLTAPEAYAQVLRANPSLYSEYVDERDDATITRKGVASYSSELRQRLARVGHGGGEILLASNVGDAAPTGMRA